MKLSTNVMLAITLMTTISCSHSAYREKNESLSHESSLQERDCQAQIQYYYSTYFPEKKDTHIEDEEREIQRQAIFNSCRQKLVIGGKTIDVYSNISFEKENSPVLNAILHIQASDASTEDIFLHLLRLNWQSQSPEKTAIIMPHFRVHVQDKAKPLFKDQVCPVKMMPKLCKELETPPKENELWWGLSLPGKTPIQDWIWGLDAASGDIKISSYDVVVELQKKLSDKSLLPHLQQTTLAGFSAGGQFVQRLALLAPRSFDSIGAKPTRWMAGAPSSYAWIGSLPQEQNCSQAYHWGYGLEGLPRFSNELSQESLLKQYFSRDVIYAVGTKDNNPREFSLDLNCGALSQGAHRMERAENFVAALKKQGENSHQLLRVLGVGHSGGAWRESGEVLPLLFPLTP